MSSPFNPSTTIEYTLGERSSVALSIYDTAGRRVARLDQGLREVGSYRVQWDGRDRNGRELSSGVYYYQLDGAGQIATRKMLLLR